MRTITLYLVIQYTHDGLQGCLKNEQSNGSEGECVSGFLQEENLLFNRAVMLIKHLTMISKYKTPHYVHARYWTVHKQSSVSVTSRLNFYPLLFHLYIAF